jgi:hypothetical protein
MKFSGEESNYYVLCKVAEALYRGVSPDIILLAINPFLKSKKKIQTELDALTIKARGGDKDAARELIKKLAEQNDGKRDDKNV